MVCLVSACSQPATLSPGTARSGVPATSPTIQSHAAGSASGSLKDPVLPIDAYRITMTQRMDLVRAAHVAIGDCMRKLGFSVNSAKDAAEVQDSTKRALQDSGVNGNLRRYGVTTMETATRYGYHTVSAVDDPPLPALDKKHLEMYGLGVLTPAMQAALNGTATGKTSGGVVTGSGGCMASAYGRIQGKGSATLGKSDVAESIRGRSFTLSLTDPAVVAVFGRWAACMKAAGYADATTPAEAYDLVKTNMTSRVVSAREIAVAKADVTCKEKNNVIPIWHGFEVEYEQGEIEKNAQALHQDRLALDAQLQRIATILAQG